jgi:excisionase family DNA binding protein
MLTNPEEGVRLDHEDRGKPSLPLVMTVKEVAVLLRCGLSTVYDLCEKGTLKSFKLRPGSRKGIRILAESVVALMKAGEAPEPVLPAPAKAKRRPRGSNRLHLPSPF